jgi:4-diphosphocytidyl-2-C-methyl-D-erythritol kinase
LNLDLQVIGRRPDGYHEIRTTMQTIELHDLLSLGRGTGETGLTISGMGVTGENSVLKAHAALERAVNRKLDVAFALEKRIPLGSGMGGASSDAAATLMALKPLFGLDVNLAPVAAEVGSDVPFFLHGGRAIVEGRGERVTPLPDEDAWFAIAWPGIELSTMAVYEAWDELGGDDLRRAAEHVEPRLSKFAQSLGAGWRMTGSGSAFFKRVDTEEEGKRAIAMLDCWKVVTPAVGRWA